MHFLSYTNNYEWIFIAIASKNSISVRTVGARLFAAKMLDVESSIEVYLKNLDHCLNGPVVVYSKLDIDLKNEVNPFKTWPWPSFQSQVFLLPKALSLY